MKYKVKSRYQTFYDGDDLEEAYQIFETMKKCGTTKVSMTPDLSAKGFVKDFQVLKNKLIFSSEYAAYLVNQYLGRYETPIELVGNQIIVLNDKFVAKIVYLTEELFKKSAEITSLAKNKLGITNDVKKYEIRLDGGKTKQIFAYSKSDAITEAKKLTDDKILNIKELKDE